MRKPVALLIVCLVLLGTGGITLAGPAGKSLFDPSRYMRVADVRPGMKGYGLSVFEGTKIEKFDVEVVDVVKDFNPKYDAILVRCPGEFLNKTGPIAGMSGSPIYLYDKDGKAKMVGAFAYGWPFAKDCLAGVQPIEYMLALPANASVSWAKLNGMSSGRHGNGDGPTPQNGEDRNANPAPRWSLDQVPLRPWGTRPNSNLFGSNPMLGERATGMQPLATPLMAGGISAQVLAKITPLFAGTGLVPMQAGTGIASEAQPTTPPKLEPGSVLAVPLLTGDMELTAVGTCTEKIGNRIFGFGHPFNNEGAIDLPMGSGSIATVVANLETSFKLGFLSRPSGALLTDQTVGVAGLVGRTAPMVPMSVRTVYDDGSVDQTYHFKAALHPKLTPLIAAAAFTMALSGDKNLPEYHTVDYDVTETFSDGRVVHVRNSSVNSDGSDIVADIALAPLVLANNPFENVALSKLTGTARVSDDARSANIVSVMVPRSKYQPGDTVKAYVSYLPFHAEESILPVEFQLPRDLPDGDYQFIVSDWTRYLEDERTANPFKFTASNIDELFSVIWDVTAIRHDAVYLRLVRQADGVAVGQTAMSHLPASRRQVMLDSGRSDITAFVSSAVKVVPARYVMSGSAAFELTVRRRGKVEAPAASAKKEAESSTKPAGGK